MHVACKKCVSDILKNQKIVYSPENSGHNYSRLLNESFESRVFEIDGTLTFIDVDGSEISVTTLQPLGTCTRLIGNNVEPADTTVHPDVLPYKLYCQMLVQGIFSSEIKNTKHCTGENARNAVMGI